MRITREEYNQFRLDFFSDFVRDEDKKKYRRMRIGQAFINKFFTDDMTHPELFYETDVVNALNIIEDWYVLPDDW